MIQKIAGITLLILFTGALVYGGINRTQAKSGDNENSVEHDTAAVTASAADGNAEAPRWGQQGQEAVEAEDHVWLTVPGVVAAVDADHLLVTAADGSQIEIADRPWEFARQLGFSAQVGDSVKLLGFDEDGTFELGAIENLASGVQTQIREEGGRPLWAGRGRRGQ